MTDIPTLEQLNAPDVTVDMVRLYVVSAYPQAPMTGEAFIREQDLASLRWLQNWWQPEHIKPEPTALPAPLLTHFIVGYQFGHTFDAQMQRFYLRCVDYCREHELDTNAPSQPKEKPKSRFADAAERMAHARAHRKPKEPAAPEPESEELIALRENLAQLQQDLAIAKQDIKTHYEAMMLSSAERDRLKAACAEQLRLIKEAVAKQ